MSKLIGKAGQKLFEKHLDKYSPADPLYEFFTDAGGKKKRRKRALPPGLSSRDIAILKSVNNRAHYLDKGFTVPCCCFKLQFGWTFLIGIIPMAGDIADASLNYFLVVRKARKAEIPDWLLRRMLLNNAISVAVGLVPVVGDVTLAMWKANSRNARLLEEFLRVRGEEYLKVQEMEAAKKGVKPSEAQSTAKLSKKAKDLAPPSDVEQIKPGAGLEPHEKASKVPSKAALTPVPVSDAGNSTSSLSAAPPKSMSKSPSGRKFGWLSGSGKSKGKAPAAGERGRFVEDVPTTKKTI